MSSPELSRRGALGLVLAGLAASGCELSTTDQSTPGGGASTSRGTAAPASPDPDEALVASMRQELGTALALVTSAASLPAVADEVAPLRRLHRRHLVTLPGEEDQQALPQLPRSPDRVRTLVRRRELRLQQALADAAVRSESGPLAALLASMSAAVAQQLVQWAEGPG